jgi:hypothetical protein
MNSGQANCKTFGEQWRDPATYRPYLAFDRRQWAWLWLQRSRYYRTQVANKSQDQRLEHIGRGTHFFPTGDLNSLFVMGYLFMRNGGPIRVHVNGCSGIQTSIRLWSAFKPNKYPGRVSALLICLSYWTRSIS